MPVAHVLDGPLDRVQRVAGQGALGGHGHGGGRPDQGQPADRHREPTLAGGPPGRERQASRCRPGPVLSRPRPSAGRAGPRRTPGAPAARGPRRSAATSSSSCAYRASSGPGVEGSSTRAANSSARRRAANTGFIGSVLSSCRARRSPGGASTCTPTTCGCAEVTASRAGATTGVVDGAHHSRIPSGISLARLRTPRSWSCLTAPSLRPRTAAVSAMRHALQEPHDQALAAARAGSSVSASSRPRWSARRAPRPRGPRWRRRGAPMSSVVVLEAGAAGLEVVGGEVAGDGHQPGAEVLALPAEASSCSAAPGRTSPR